MMILIVECEFPQFGTRYIIHINWGCHPGECL